MASHRAILLASLLLASPLVAGYVGTVKGSFTVAGKTFTPDNVYAVLIPGIFNSDTKYVALYFTLKPRDVEAFLDDSRPLEGTALQVEIGADSFVKDSLIVGTYTFRVLGPEGDCCTATECYRSGDVDAVYEKKKFELRKNGRVAGRVTIDAAFRTTSGKRCPVGADIEFDAPILRERTR
jgi:hypothetical protein